MEASRSSGNSNSNLNPNVIVFSQKTLQKPNLITSCRMIKSDDIVDGTDKLKVHWDCCRKARDKFLASQKNPIQLTGRIGLIVGVVGVIGAVAGVCTLVAFIALGLTNPLFLTLAGLIIAGGGVGVLGGVGLIAKELLTSKEKAYRKRMQVVIEDFVLPGGYKHEFLAIRKELIPLIEKRFEACKVDLSSDEVFRKAYGQYEIDLVTLIKKKGFSSLSEINSMSIWDQDAQKLYCYSSERTGSLPIESYQATNVKEANNHFSQFETGHLYYDDESTGGKYTGFDDEEHTAKKPVFLSNSYFFTDLNAKQST